MSGKSKSCVIICQSDHETAAAQVLSSILTAANTLTETNMYNMSILSMARLHTMESADWRDRTAIFLGSMHDRWSVPRPQASRVKTILAMANRTLLIGGAVFLPLETSFALGHTLAVHPNFQTSLREEHLDLTISEGATASSGPFHSAISALAAQMMLIELISQDYGEFTARSVSEYVGLSQKNQQNDTGLIWSLVQTAQGDKLICDVLELMGQHIEEPLQTAEISEIVGVSTRNIERRFKQKTEISPQIAYRKIRLHHAKQLVSQTNMAMIEVALASGYQTYGTLTEHYKKEFGCTPKQMRNAEYYGLKP
ncbi:helix-turn-helix domain-containing protein [Shimia litoralis]|uniref:Helix-turn-helix domain-containing protein n=1 Tax=Shimia litoralis TaxID=420403 RepID=A0A4U7NA81_9RHOB|nr:helix-turn-helix domain-containing protein [Shimia litoralis]TKZ22366.1 helix-turn-helix domain-containing protein [Shimia litoralis]